MGDGTWQPVLIGVLIPLGLLALLGLILGAMYNGLVKARLLAKNAWSQIDVQLKRRRDLIPNLVETVKGYMAHEKETLEAVIKARQAAGEAHSIRDQIAAENELSATLGRLFALTENYPELKADRSLAALQEELASTENKIGFARQYYNDSVLRYNTRRETFPTALIAGLFHFEREAFFEIEDPRDRQAVDVRF
ncbi:MAG: LemA family protein [candidate division BRC1 bacterium ADurb.BinA364]|nr:MAG: LemA family protein [candidate division BRC1 bacterium ADurb.BinA364]